MKLKVFGEEIKVLKSNDIETAGEYHVLDKVIYIHEELVGDNYHETILHELMEAVFFRCSIYQALDHGTKEIFIDCCAKAIVENFKLTLKK